MAHQNDVKYAFPLYDCYRIHMPLKKFAAMLLPD